MKKIVYLTAAVALLAISTTAQAAPPPPDSETGSLLNSRSWNFSATASGKTLTGTLTEYVYLEAGNTLNFDYQVSNTSPSGGGKTPDVLGTVSATDFTGFSRVVGQTSSGYQVAAADTSTGTLNFYFIPAMPTGNTSSLIIVRTNARGYTNGTASVIDGGTVGPNTTFFAPSLNPNAAVPEPASLLLLGGLSLGLGGTGLRRWRQRNAVNA